MAFAFSPLAFGWQYIVAATIEGIPVVFTESATGKSLPTGYTSEDASLIVEGSAEVGQTVDRDSGIGVGLPFTIRLQDTDTVRSYVKRWTYEARLTADLAHNATTVTVDSTSGWPSSGAIYIGNERITYTGKGATTFTGATRGVVGYAYAHKADKVGALVTSSPRYMRGREVKVYVLPVDPTGYVTGSALLDDAMMVWRGHISSGPHRAGVQWQMEALSIDRKLARPLAAKISGRITSTEFRTNVSKQATVDLVVSAYRDDMSTLVFKHEISFAPFAALDEDALYSPSKIRAAIVDGFAAAVTNKSATADLDALEFIYEKAPYDPNDPYAGKPLAEFWWRIGIGIKYDANIRWVKVGGSFFGAALSGSTWVMIHPPASQTRVVKIPEWKGLTPDPTRPGLQKTPAPTIVLDAGSASDIPSAGVVEVDGQRYTYGLKASAGASVYLGKLTANDKGATGDLLGKQATIILEDSGSPSAVALKMIESSGTSSLRGSSDTLQAGQGYAIDDDAVNESQIGDVLDGGSAGSLTLTIDGADASLVDHLGGLMSITQTAIVARQDTSATNRAIKISAVHTTAGGAAHTATINDSHLLTRTGEPVAPQRAKVAPNIIEIGSTRSEDRQVFNDHGAIAAQGANKHEITIPTAELETLGDVAPYWAALRFADVQAQIVALRVVPWLDVDVGDVVKLSLTHPALWSYSAGAPGYSGQGRILGKAIDLASSAMTLTVLIDGIVAGATLCPSAEVSALAGTAANPSTVDIDTKFEPLISKAISEAGGNIRLIHYRPGQAEDAANYIEVSAATVTSGVCRLTVASISAGSIVINDTRLTWPETANASDYQSQYMHVGDGSRWL